MCVTRHHENTQKATLNKNSFVSKFSYDNAQTTAMSTTMGVSGVKQLCPSSFSKNYFAVGPFRSLHATNATTVQNVLKYELEETFQDQQQEKTTSELAANCTSPCVSLPSELPIDMPTMNNYTDDEDDECRLDEDEWTESSGSSSISSACFLHESCSDQIFADSETKGLESLSFSVSFPTITTSTLPSTTHSQAKSNVPLSSSLPRVQVRPGLSAVFLGANETWDCIRGQDTDGSDAYDRYKFVHCANTKCRAGLCCVEAAKYVLCPDCCQMSQTNDNNNGETNESTDAILAGLGFTFTDIRNWEYKLR